MVFLKKKQKKKTFCFCHLHVNCHLKRILFRTIRTHNNMDTLSSQLPAASILDPGQTQDEMITGQRSGTRSRTIENSDWRWLQKKTVMGWGWQTKIQLACILLPIQINPFHLRAHQLSNCESNGDVRAARISTRPAVGAPLRHNQKTITAWLLLQHTFFFFLHKHC